MSSRALSTRVRAAVLRTFRGRRPGEAGWEDQEPVSAGAPARYVVGQLVVDVTPRGLKAAGANPPSIVYEVRISSPRAPIGWASSYGFPPRDARPERAADAALDELDEVDRDGDGWLGRVTAGMSDDEVEAMLDSPAVRLDQRAAAWVGAELAPLRAARSSSGTWLG